MKKSLKTVISLVLALTLGITPVFAAISVGDGETVRTDSGVCNEYETVVWEMSESGGNIVLKIEPAAGVTLPSAEHPEYSVMEDYEAAGNYSTAPWVLVKEEYGMARLVGTLTVASGITVIGEYSFINQTEMTAVTLYPTLNQVNANAFHGCENLKTVSFRGTKKEWEQIVIEEGNEPLLNAEIIFKEGVLKGDLNDDDVVDIKDAVYLLYSLYFEDIYKRNQNCDFNGDKTVDEKDAVYLLFYYFFPEIYTI